MKNNFLAIIVVVLLAACKAEPVQYPPPANTAAWQDSFDEQLQLNGHRNWILVVDKAFPQQPGIKIINTKEELIPVLERVLMKIKSSTHVKPVVYNDAELAFITDSLAPGANQYKEDLKKILNNYNPQPLLHDTVFVKMDQSSKLFSITVIKTETVIPYSSVFIQLDCAYWNGDQEKKLREIMKSTESK